MTSSTCKTNYFSLIHLKYQPVFKHSVILALLLPAILSLSLHTAVREAQKETDLPPQEWSMHIAVAFSETQAQTFSRAFNRTMINITRLFMENYHQHNITLSPLIITLPENQQFSDAILEKTCTLLEGKHVVVVLIIGGSPAGFAVALAAGTAGIPVLWARGGTGDLVGYTQSELSPLEVRLEPSVREMLEAMRALLLATHWHTFTVLADNSASSGVLLRRDLVSILKAPPLNPTLLMLPNGGAQRHSIFRRLADISRATRGVVLLICNLQTAKRVTTEAKRLNMMSGHFVFLWIDTSASSTLAAPRSLLFAADNNTGSDPSSFNTTVNIPAPYEQSITQVSTRSRSRFSSSKRRERNAGVNGNPWDLSSGNNSTLTQAAFTVSSLEEAATGIRKTRASEKLVRDVSSSVKYIKASSLFLSTTKSESTRMHSHQTSSDILRTSSQRENTVTESDMNNIKGTFESAASRGTNFNNLDLISKSDVLSSHSTRARLKTNFGVPVLGQDRIGDHMNFRDTKPRSQFVENVKSASGGWLYQENKNGGNERYKVNFPGINEEGGDEDVEDSLPIGLLAMRTQRMRLDRHLVKAAARLMADTLLRVLTLCADWMPAPPSSNNSCWISPSDSYRNFSNLFARELQTAVAEVLAGKRVYEVGDKVDRSLVASFDILNLAPEKSATDYDGTLGVDEPEGEGVAVAWRTVGEVTGRAVRLDTIVWPGGDLVVAGLSARTRSVFRIVTALAPPFVMESELDEDGQCLRGVPCHRVLTSDKDNLTLVFNEMETHERLEEEEEELSSIDEESPQNIRTVKKSDSKSVPYNAESQLHGRNSEDVRRRPLTSSSSSFELPSSHQRYKYRTNCCYGLAMDLLENVAQELEFDFHLYIVADGLFGSRTRDVHPSYHSRPQNTVEEDSDAKWNGIVGDLVSGAAHMSFAALSVSSARSEVIDFSAPYFYSGVSFLAAPTQKSEIPLLAFLLPFSPELWIAIFTSLNITAMAVAVYEWLSPFGLNPWGRQRSKNFSIASALWVMWGLLCGHLVAFKAPKSWPNKFLINVWGGFSVIFVASYTANIAALIAGLFFHNDVSNYLDRSLLSQRVGTPRASAADYYVHRNNPHLWEHMQKYAVIDVEDGIQHLKNGSLDILIADTPILDYYRATDHGCKLQRIGDAINEDTYAVGMAKGFPLKDSISAVIAKYSSNGYMDILQEKWYGGLPCFKLATEIAQPQPLGVAAVTGVFILLGLGMVLGCLILIFEHLFYRYTLPILRHQPKGTIWRSRNIMFFSQKLYRFINCVELVSPHHAARELVHTIRQGQITSLFQKSVKRKEHEQRRRRKSKAQFFEMIQEIRRVQQEERDQSVLQEEEPEPETEAPSTLLKPERRSSKNPSSPLSPPAKSSPRKFGKSKSPRSLEARKFYRELFSPGGNRKTKSKSPNTRRRFSTDMIFSPLRSRLECPSNAVGRRLSKDSGGCNSPPDINSRRLSNLDVSAKQDKLSSLDLRFQQGRSHLDVRLPDTRSSGSSLNIIPRLGSSSNTNVSSSKHEVGGRRPEVSSVQERLNTIGSRLGSLSSTDVSSRSQKLSRSRSRSPIPSIMNRSFPSSSDGLSEVSTIPKHRDRVRSDTNALEAVQSRPSLRTPSPTEVQGNVIQHTDLNSISGRSHSLESNRDLSQEDEMKPVPGSDGTTAHHPKLKRSDFILPYESIIEVNVTCCDSTPEKTKDYSTESKIQDLSASQQHINAEGSSPSPYSSLKRQQFRRRQSHQPRLETVYTPQHQVVSPSSSSQSSTKEFLVPVQRHENSSPSSSSRSPARRRHQSHPVRTDLAPQEKSHLAASTSIPDVSSAVSPNRQRHHRHHRHHRESSHECDEVFDDIPPPPPPPFCHPRNGSNGESPLDRLNREELVALWRSSESELRSHLLRAIRAKEVTDPP